MASYKLCGKAVINDTLIENAAVCYEDGIITYAGDAAASPAADNTETVNGLIVPGFVDIHCHAGRDYRFESEPISAAKFHLDHGTTTMCATMYRDLGIQGLIDGTNLIKSKVDSGEITNVFGVHLEGPYLNPIYGSKSDGIPICAVPEEYNELMELPFVKHVTIAPEVDGTYDLIKKLVARGDVLVSLGHSSASPEQVDDAVKMGALNITHTFDATGASISPTRYGGTIETDFNVASIIHDELTFEVICDSDGVHVRPEMLKLLYMAVGPDKIIAITDCCGSPSPGEVDVHFENGEVYGSNLTMNRVFENFVNYGYSIIDTVKFTSKNPAIRMGFYDKVGSLETGKYADIAVLDDNFQIVKVVKSSISNNL